VKSDIHLSYDEFASNPQFTYQLGVDTLIIGVNQNSPIFHLAMDDLQHIYQGEITSTSDLKKKCEGCIIEENIDVIENEPFRVWGYPENSFLEDSIQNTFQIRFFSPVMFVAPNPSLMEQAVLLERTAIGIFPENAISDQLRVIPIVDLANEQTYLTILASSQTEPDLFLEGFLECVQKKLVE
jgi:hypothetical protein